MKFVFAVLASLALVTSVSHAEPASRNPVVIELFTSQGCSSCPPADELLAELAQRDGIIALALHVDYWDYIGWKDDLAQPAFTVRQKGYAHEAGRRMIYTPQMVVNGREDVVGTRAMEIADLVSAYNAAPDLARVEAVRNGSNVEVSIKPMAELGTGDLDVKLLSYLPKVTVDIHRGENAGRRIVYHNSVLDLAVVGAWDGQSTLTMDVPWETDNPSAVIVQKQGQKGPGQIVAAGWVRE